MVHDLDVSGFSNTGWKDTSFLPNSITFSFRITFDAAIQKKKKDFIVDLFNF